MFEAFEGLVSSWVKQILDKVDDYIDRRLNLEQESLALGLISRRRICQELEVKEATLRNWEAMGLRRYQPPVDKPKHIYYLKDDILKFMTIYEEKNYA